MSASSGEWNTAVWNGNIGNTSARDGKPNIADTKTIPTDGTTGAKPDGKETTFLRGR